jgi:hypothetical protein
MRVGTAPAGEAQGEVAGAGSPQPPLHVEVALINVRTGQSRTFDEGAMAQVADELQRVVVGLLTGLHEGVFQQHAPSCRTCPFTCVCGTGIDALCERKRTDHRVSRFLAAIGLG